MSLGAASSNLRAGVLPVLVLAIAVSGLRPLERRLQGGEAGTAGGLRTIVASGCWLKASLAWEQRDAAATLAFLKLSVAADESPSYFWLNGARMIAYDLPEWRVDPAMPAGLQRMIRLEQAQAALDFLAQGLSAHAADPEFLIEMANIRLRALNDREGAADLFRQAATKSGAPYYAARIHAELLLELGRPAEALVWLKQVLPGLPATDPAARCEIVQQRITALEAQLSGR